MGFRTDIRAGLRAGLSNLDEDFGDPKPLSSGAIRFGFVEIN